MINYQKRNQFGVCALEFTSLGHRLLGLSIPPYQTLSSDMQGLPLLLSDFRWAHVAELFAPS